MQNPKTMILIAEMFRLDFKFTISDFVHQCGGGLLSRASVCDYTNKKASERESESERERAE